MSIEQLKQKLEELNTKLSSETDDAEKAKLELDIAQLERDLLKLESEGNSDEDEENDETKTETDDEKIERLANEKLTKMKANMDKMAEKLAKIEKEKEDLAKAQKAEKMKRLEEEGKLQELAEMKVAEAEAKIKLLEEENVKLKRDQVVNEHLSALEFKNDRSREMARRDIVEQLVKDEDGNWTHSSGKTIASFVEEYSRDQDNEFLFRVKANTGNGTKTSTGAPDTTQKKSLAEMSTQEVLALAAKGKLGQFGY